MPEPWIEWARAIRITDWYAERIAEARREGAAEVTAKALSPEIVETASREAFWADDMGEPHTWENIPEEGRENYRTLVRAVLRAVFWPRA